MVRNFIKKEDGVIAIEAAMVLPVILAFYLLLISLVQIVIAEIALQNAVTETAKTSAHYGFVIDKGQDALDEKAKDMVNGITDKATGYIQSDLLTDDIKQQAVDYIIDKSQKRMEQFGVEFEIPKSTSFLGNFFANDIYEPMVRYFYGINTRNNSFFNKESVKVVDSTWTGGRDGTNSEIAVTATVDLEIRVPFYTFDLTIKKKAVERAWTGSS